jgi:hypothetical protein
MTAAVWTKDTFFASHRMAWHVSTVQMLYHHHGTNESLIQQ